jgi:CRISPR-associated protein Cas4
MNEDPKIIKNSYFPISWLLQFEYCEYQIYLQYIIGIKPEITQELILGKEIHEELHEEFLEGAEEATFEDIINESKKRELISREVYVESRRYGVRGSIDEILFTPKKFVIIDDKPRKMAFSSEQTQVYGYCLAFKEYFKDIIEEHDSRPIFAALRERGTNNIIWIAPFNQKSEQNIIQKINRIHSLISGNGNFISTKNKNKCNKCRLREFCDR